MSTLALILTIIAVIMFLHRLDEDAEQRIRNKELKEIRKKKEEEIIAKSTDIEEVLKLLHGKLLFPLNDALRPKVIEEMKSLKKEWELGHKKNESFYIFCERKFKNKIKM